MSIDLIKEQTAREMANALNIIALSKAKDLGTITSMASIQQLVRQGLGPQAFPVGAQIMVPHAVYGDIIFDVLAHDHHKKPGDAGAHTMTIGMHACINGRQMDGTEALYACASELAAGTYHFKLLAGYDTDYGGGKNIQFTLTQSVPVGGVIMFPWAYQKQSTATKVSTYASRESTAPIETVSVSEGTDGTDLGVADGTSESMNHIHRARYGSNNWAESAARQWLNSAADANAWWHPQTIFDRPPSYANAPGLLAGFDEDFLAAIGPVDVTTARNTVYEAGNATGGSYETRDKFFLLSMAEVGLGKNDQITEGSVLAYYDGATDVDRIKYDISNGSTARYWWMRSPYPWNAYIVRSVNPGGSLSSNSAYDGRGAAAACVIY